MTGSRKEDCGRDNSCRLSATEIRLAPTGQDIDALYNRPTRIAVDAENNYILPAEQPEE